MNQTAAVVLDEIIAEIKPEITEYPETQKRVFTTFGGLKEYFEKELRFWQPFQTDRSERLLVTTATWDHDARG
jgi:hypothetical protein